MFVPRSTRRIRFARTAFLVAGVLPCAALVAWAVQRHSDAHRDAVRRDWERAVGLPLAVASVEHPLPGVVRARDWSLAADGLPVLDGATLDVETSPTEVRLALPRVRCDPAGVAALAGLAGEWLLRGARFRHDVVIDVGDVAWRTPGDTAEDDSHALGSLRIECVTQAGARAIRIVRRHGGDGVDEVRIVRGDDADGPGCRIDAEASCAEWLPCPILAAAVRGTPVAGLSLGAAARVRGRLAITWHDGRSTGSASGSLDRIDLAAASATLAAGASGTAEVEVRDVTWRDGRLVSCDVGFNAAGGRVDQRLLAALVSTVGCRAGAAYVGPAPERERPFDAAACDVRIDGRGIRLAGTARLGGSLAVADGRPLLEPPAGVVPPERVAWLLASPGSVHVPSSGPGAWLMSLLPTGGTAKERTSQAGGGADPRDF